MSQADISILDSLPATASSTICATSSSPSFPPSIFLRMCLTDSGAWDTDTSDISPIPTEAHSRTEWGTRMVPGCTRVSEMETIAMASLPPEILTRSPSETHRVRQSSSCISTVGSDASRS